MRKNLLSTKTFFTRTLKKVIIIYDCRCSAQQKVLFYFFYFYFFENFLEKQCAIVGHIEIERPYVKQLSDRTLSVVLWSH